MKNFIIYLIVTAILFLGAMYFGGISKNNNQPSKPSIKTYSNIIDDFTTLCDNISESTKSIVCDNAFFFNTHIDDDIAHSYEQIIENYKRELHNALNPGELYQEKNTPAEYYENEEEFLEFNCDNIGEKYTEDEFNDIIKDFGYQCQSNCSEHIAGYKWACKNAFHGKNFQCLHTSRSLYEGCMTYKLSQ